jgi:hypothetical protein
VRCGAGQITDQTSSGASAPPASGRGPRGHRPKDIVVDEHQQDSIPFERRIDFDLFGSGSVELSRGSFAA